MRQLFISLFLSLFLSHAQALVIFDPDQIEAQADSKIEYTFDLYEDSSTAQLTDKDLNLTHTQILHMLVFDASLKEFNHVHPQYDGKRWTVEMNLPVNGSYFVWLQGETKSGEAFSIKKHLEVSGGQKGHVITSLGEQTFAVDGATRLDLQPTPLKAGGMAMIDFVISRTDGQQPQLAPYLGAFAHVIVTDFASDELIHVHPMEGSEPYSGMLHAVFPKAGEYRIWIQFIDHNELKTIPLSVVVK